jgi:hypothetical protein
MFCKYSRYWLSDEIILEDLLTLRGVMLALESEASALKPTRTIDKFLFRMGPAFRGLTLLNKLIKKAYASPNVSCVIGTDACCSAVLRTAIHHYEISMSSCALYRLQNSYNSFT